MPITLEDFEQKPAGNCDLAQARYFNLFLKFIL